MCNKRWKWQQWFIRNHQVCEEMVPLTHNYVTAWNTDANVQTNTIEMLNYCNYTLNLRLSGRLKDSDPAWTATEIKQKQMWAYTSKPALSAAHPSHSQWTKLNVTVNVKFPSNAGMLFRHKGLLGAYPAHYFRWFIVRGQSHHMTGAANQYN